MIVEDIQGSEVGGTATQGCDRFNVINFRIKGQWGECGSGNGNSFMQRGKIDHVENRKIKSEITRSRYSVGN